MRCLRVRPLARPKIYYKRGGASYGNSGSGNSSGDLSDAQLDTPLLRPVEEETGLNVVGSGVTTEEQGHSEADLMDTSRPASIINENPNPASNNSEEMPKERGRGELTTTGGNPEPTSSGNETEVITVQPQRVISEVTTSYGARVEVAILEPAEFSEICQQLFGRELSELELAEVVGAPDGAQVEVEPQTGDRLAIGVEHPYYELQVRYLERRYYGKNYIVVLNHDGWFISKDAPPGIGTRVLAQGVKGAIKLGLRKILTSAAGMPHSLSHKRGDGLNGYYTWPRLGFNAKLNKRALEKLPDQFKAATDLNDLFSMEGGAEWWKLNGEGGKMEFDLRAGSKSLKVLKGYLQSKGIPW